MNMDIIIGKEIGSGGTSNVYEYGDNAVIKVYKPHVSDGVINNEKYIGELLNKTTLDIPDLIGSIDVNGKKALIYERIEGKVIAESLLNGWYETEIGYKYAKLHFDIHQKSIIELPSQYDFLKNRILQLENIAEEERESLLGLLDSFPKDNKLCHGDYQPFNIINSYEKFVVIDWNGACSGNPIFDVAWSYMTLNSPVVSHVLGEKVAELFTNFNNDYINKYCALSEISKDLILMCMPIVAARRLYDNNQNDNEHTRIEREWLYNYIQNM
jgi:Ser/Thr protein kinase RdoA (MazF antagonist)